MIPHADTCTCPDCIRIVAFAAIRRAASEARFNDQMAHKYRHIDRSAVALYAAKANCIRDAIRTAIGSAKTPA